MTEPIPLRVFDRFDRCLNFLDLIVRQISSLREATGAPVRLLLMNSFSSSDDTLEHLAKNAPEGLREASEVELMQNQVPKIDAAKIGLSYSQVLALMARFDEALEG